LVSQNITKPQYCMFDKLVYNVSQREIIVQIVEKIFHMYEYKKAYEFVLGTSKILLINVNTQEFHKTLDTLKLYAITEIGYLTTKLFSEPEVLKEYNTIETEMTVKEKEGVIKCLNQYTIYQQ